MQSIQKDTISDVLQALMYLYRITRIATLNGGMHQMNESGTSLETECGSG